MINIFKYKNNKYKGEFYILENINKLKEFINKLFNINSNEEINFNKFIPKLSRF